MQIQGRDHLKREVCEYEDRETPNPDLKDIEAFFTEFDKFFVCYPLHINNL